MTDGLGHVGGTLAPTVLLAANSAWSFRGAFAVMAATGLVTAVLLRFGRRATHTVLH
ncbi:hypothetical protein [Streptomyces sp. SYSU K21746]